MLKNTSEIIGILAEIKLNNVRVIWPAAPLCIARMRPIVTHVAWSACMFVCCTRALAFKTFATPGTHGTPGNLPEFEIAPGK